MDIFTPEKRSRVMARIRGRDTKPELVVRRLVHAMGYRYRLHDRKLPGCPDLVFKRLKSVIFVHGCFWHRHDCHRGCRMPKTRFDYWHAKISRNHIRDVKSVATLRKLGWQVFVVWECETSLAKRVKLRNRVAKFLSRNA